MERNLDRRVETLCPVLDPDIARFIRETILEAYLFDTERASVLRADGSYERADPGRSLGKRAATSCLTCITFREVCASGDALR